jgi:hypothetical protein
MVACGHSPATCEESLVRSQHSYTGAGPVLPNASCSESYVMQAVLDPDPVMCLTSPDIISCHVAAYLPAPVIPGPFGG